MAQFAAVVLTGGSGTRLGGADKATLVHAGRTLLEHALAAVSDAAQTVVVGPPVEVSREVVFARESPPLGGPAAGLLAGRDALTESVSLVLLLAVDMPWVTAATVRRLCAAAEGYDGALLVDAGGRRQLAGALSLAALDRVRPPRGEEQGLALHRLLGGLELASVAAEDDEARDIDTWADLPDPPRG